MTTSNPKNIPIYFEKEGFAKLNIFIKENTLSKIFVLVDENTKKDCLPFLQKYVDFSFQILKIKSGETHKNIQILAYLWEELTKKGADRNSLLINLGGGVITDMGGFVAATFKRGISFINIPTSLLGMVDAAIGGKTGIDFLNLKNQIGLFTHPKMLVVNPRFINTLNQREVLSGLAEIIKYGLIDDISIWNSIKEKRFNVKKIPSDIILKSIAIKERIVARDPLEKGIRKILNFGHTLGHAVETYYFSKNRNEQLLHGEAVAVGMILALSLSNQLTGLSKLQSQTISQRIKHLYQHQIPLKIKKNEIPAILKLLKHDKKNEAGIVNFILLADIGKPLYNQQVSKEQLLSAFDFYNNL
jgi:3-dehydroquinate synthase